MEPWYKVVIPRQELREGRSLDPSEFAVHLEQVVSGDAPRDYVEPEKFFSRNYFSKALVEHCGMVLRRLSGETANTAPVLSLITQFGGGKTHTLTTLYHLCNTGSTARNFAGVSDMMKSVALADIPQAKVAIFVGNAWDASPGRETPWLDLADQLAGEKGRALFSRNAPGTKAIGDLFRLVGKPVMILFDETLNYLGRHPEQSSQFHSFMQNLTVALTSAERAVGLFSLPASPTEMTDDLREWQDKLTKVVGRVGKDLVANDASEVSEIVRRRLFEDAGRESMKRASARQFASWVFNRRDRLPPEWGQLSEDQIRAQFEACYPFHPATLTVFQRKWQTLPQFQQTRTTLAMLGMWISCAYREGYGKARREPLLTLGSAPLADREFLSAVLRQMGEQRLQAAIHADITAPLGQPKSHAETLDDEDAEGSGRSAIHQRVAKTLFFESCGGQTDKAGHLPEMYFAVGDPDTETTLIHTAVQNLERRCYFLRPAGVDGWRFGHLPTLKKVHADRKQALDPDDVKRSMGDLVKTVFKKEAEIHLSLFPKEATDVVDQAMLTMAVLRPDETLERSDDAELRQRITDWTRKCGQSSRQNPGGILWMACEGSGSLRTGVEELLAWQAVADDANRGLLGELEGEDVRRIQRELNTAKSQIEDRVWSSYNHLLLWEAGVGKLKEISLGQLHPSEARSITSAVLARLRHDSLLSREIGSSYIERNWPPALKESGAWPLASLKAAFFQGQFTRLEKAEDALRTTIARAVSQGLLGLASGKDPACFDRVWFKEQVEAADITFDYDAYLLTAAKAKALKQAPSPSANTGAPTTITTTTAQHPPTPAVPTATSPVTQQVSAPAVPKVTPIQWQGQLKREQWNLFSLKVLTRLAQAEDVQIDVRVSAKLKDGQPVEPLNAALRELGIADSFSAGAPERPASRHTTEPKRSVAAPRFDGERTTLDAGNYILAFVFSLLRSSGGQCNLMRLARAYALLFQKEHFAKLAEAQFGADAEKWVEKFNQPVEAGWFLPIIRKMDTQDMVSLDVRGDSVFVHQKDAQGPPVPACVDTDVFLVMRVLDLVPDSAVAAPVKQLVPKAPKQALEEATIPA